MDEKTKKSTPSRALPRYRIQRRTRATTWAADVHYRANIESSLEFDQSLELSSQLHKMGGCFSCKPSLPFDCVRVVHLSGYVEDFPEAVTVAQVTATGGKPSSTITHFICSSAHLLSSGFSHRMPLDARLHPGNIYLLLPYSIFQSDSSPVDLASLATRLTAIAKRSGAASPTTANGVLGLGRRENTGFGACCGPARKTTCTTTSTTFRTWKPILEAIEEKSIDQRSQ
ncbi:hypothetical protein ACLOJK_030823 [Asimina triloba]